MEFAQKILEAAKQKQKIIVLPESDDARVAEAGIRAATQGIAKIIFAQQPCLPKSAIASDNVTLIEPKNFSEKEKLISALYEKRKEKGMTMEQASELVLNNPLYFATMLVECGFADGMVAGAKNTTADVLRPALQVIKAKQGIKLVSSCFVMAGTDNSDGLMLFADCALNMNPTSEELADIAVATATTARDVCGIEPRVAFLSFSTKGSAKSEEIDVIKNAMDILKTRKVNFAFDGEMQADAALVPDVAKLKAPDSKVAGNANCLIFPSLNAGNIGYKLFQRAAGGKVAAIGPIMQGLNKPVNDLSRGCKAEEIVLAIALTALQAK